MGSVDLCRYLQPEPLLATMPVPARHGPAYYRMAREYGVEDVGNPVTERLLAGVAGVPNAYAYASNNPLRNGDPDGLLDYTIPCKTKDGKKSTTYKAPGKNECQDLEELKNAAKQACSGKGAGGCKCNAFNNLVSKITQMCSTGAELTPATPEVGTCGG